MKQKITRNDIYKRILACCFDPSIAEEKNEGRKLTKNEKEIVARVVAN